MSIDEKHERLVSAKLTSSGSSSGKKEADMLNKMYSKDVWEQMCRMGFEEWTDHQQGKAPKQVEVSKKKETSSELKCPKCGTRLVYKWGVFQKAKVLVQLNWLRQAEEVYVCPECGYESKRKSFLIG